MHCPVISMRMAVQSLQASSKPGKGGFEQLNPELIKHWRRHFDDLANKKKKRVNIMSAISMLFLYVLLSTSPEDFPNAGQYKKPKQGNEVCSSCRCEEYVVGIAGWISVCSEGVRQPEQQTPSPGGKAQG